MLDASHAEGLGRCHCIPDLAAASGRAGHARGSPCACRLGAWSSLEIVMSIAEQVKVMELEKKVAALEGHVHVLLGRVEELERVQKERTLRLNGKKPNG